MRILIPIIVLTWMVFAPAFAVAFGERVITLAKHTLHVELAVEREDLAQGLMFRKTIAPYDGMLFDFQKEIFAPMWMKNTLIPLDMVFFDETQKAVCLHHDAVPHSLEHIECPTPARYVLELNAGDIERLGLKLGNVFKDEIIK